MPEILKENFRKVYRKYFAAYEEITVRNKVGIPKVSSGFRIV